MRRRRRSIKEMMFENSTYKMVALIITLILWVTVLKKGEIVFPKSVQITFLTDEQTIIINEVTEKVVFHISGSKILLKNFFKKKQKPLVVDLSHIKAGRRFVRIPEDILQLPFGAKVLSVSPSTVYVELDKMTTKLLPIKVSFDQLGGAEKYKVVRVQPHELNINGASSLLSRIKTLWTETIVLDFEKIDNNNNNTIEMEALLSKIEQPGILPLSLKKVIVKFEKESIKKMESTTHE